MKRGRALSLFFGFFLGIYVFLFADGFQFIKVTHDDGAWTYLLKLIGVGFVGAVVGMIVFFIVGLFRKNKRQPK